MNGGEDKFPPSSYTVIINNVLIHYNDGGRVMLYCREIDKLAEHLEKYFIDFEIVHKLIYCNEVTFKEIEVVVDTFNEAKNETDEEILLTAMHLNGIVLDVFEEIDEEVKRLYVPFY